MDDLSLFTPADRQDLSYAMCVGGMGIVGGAVGRLAGGVYGLLAVAAAGVAYGLITCKKLSPVIEQKLLSGTDRLSDSEILQVLRVLQQDAQVHRKSDGIYILAEVRHRYSKGLDRLRVESLGCVSMRSAAAQLLAGRSATGVG